MKKSERVAIVLHGEFSKPDDLWAWSEEADMVIAADGAADTLLSLGIKPDIVIGDMDGILAETLNSLPEDSVVRDEDQNSTDFQKALRYAKDVAQAESVAVLAYEGSRVDHMLSSLFFSAALASELAIRFVGNESQALVLAEGRHTVSVTAGTRVSLLPLGTATVGNASGFEYDVEGVTLSVGGRDGVSNRANGNEISLTISSGAVLAFVQRFDGEEQW